MSDPQALLRALARRLEQRAFHELVRAADETNDEIDQEIARVRATACKTVAEEVLLLLAATTPEERT